MDSLSTEPVASLIDRLFSEAEVNMEPVRAEFAALTPVERAILLGSRTGYREFYMRMSEAALPVSRDEGKLLYLLSRSHCVRSIVEFGMSFGISTIFLAAALRDNGGGRLITTEFEASKLIRGRANIEAAGFLDLVEIRAGDALDTLSHDLPSAIDLIVLDGAKALYGDVLDLLEDHLSSGGLIFADNADMCPAYLDRVRAAAGPYLSLPFGDAELSWRRT
jgi:predicted O-methyltransferase YrrM